uniref:lysozyme n=1 Tax=Mytilus galloprovincialis TaxID=29158 RepID=I6QSK6_MYTGA|nr:c-type lysozyme [Mytilus galloprovincialis]
MPSCGGILFVSILLVLVLVGYSYGATKTKCQVVQALRNQGVPDSDLRDWLCLVKHESNFHYDAIGTNSGSKDYGIFQINSKFNCGRPSGTSTSICWRVNTYGCADSCTSLTNSDISNDAYCAVRIKKCGGFSKWNGWKDYCSNVQGSEYDYSTC